MDQILNNVSHRPYALPQKIWQYYQEWNNVLFLHYEIEADTLRQLVPEHLSIDSFEGKCYISVVPFSMEKIRPRVLPSFPPISNFHEINVRTYVYHNGYNGVYFINIEAQKRLSTIISKILSGLPYEKSNIYRKDQLYINHNTQKNYKLHLQYEIGKRIIDKTNLEKWLTERYCLFLERGRKMYRYDIHHVEWPLLEVSFSRFHIYYKLQSHLKIDNQSPLFSHYSPGVQVLAWERTLL
ncbi:MAG: hypothetical protein DI598_14250 [Pseudopedobacter saltans]|uniref:DUF2071 domain-containing protein n=1 Tax=Pseudopedobacter saltans TaxID=151895 RepID=A0A2W5EST8_9SPHI|nr:MAG: hypothetical protein DI598_14250 [Pseudopedobacter saltans]